MRLFKKHINTILLLVIILVVNLLAGSYYSRFDLTKEKKFSLSPVTKSFMQNLDDIVSIKVFLTGKLPSGMDELEQATQDMLNEFKAYAGNKLEYEFVDLTKMDKAMQEEIGADLYELGLQPTSLTVVEDGEQTQKVIFPGAVVTYKGASMPVTLLQNQAGLDQFTVLSNSITLLEYKLSNAVQKLMRKNPPTIAFSQGHGEAQIDELGEIVRMMQQENFAIAAIDLTQSFRVEPFVDVLVIAKPTIPFTEKEKYKIDQFVMNGGRVLWMIDQMDIEMDSLNGSSAFFAQERDLNLNDILFKYGARINADLIQDLNNTRIEIQTGMVNGQPQNQSFDWLYYPLLTPYNDHPVSRNLAPITSRFASSIDTIRNDGVKKSVLLSTSDYSKAQMAPVMVHLGIVQQQVAPATFKQSRLPVAVSLEGTFTSIFKNRLAQSFIDVQDSVGKLEYKELSVPTKMIVISDGDIIKNTIHKGKLAPLGFAVYGPNQKQLVFDNKPFIKNCLEYLIDDNNLIETRTKEFKLRQLDAIKVKENKKKWQYINLFAPLVLLAIFGLLYNFIRKKRFA